MSRAVPIVMDAGSLSVASRRHSVRPVSYTHLTLPTNREV